MKPRENFNLKEGSVHYKTRVQVANHLVFIHVLCTFANMQKPFCNFFKLLYFKMPTNVSAKVDQNDKFSVLVFWIKSFFITSKCRTFAHWTLLCGHLLGAWGLLTSLRPRKKKPCFMSGQTFQVGSVSQDI